jgi:hypothetical protein
MSALCIGVQGSTPFIDDVEEKFWAIIAENLRHCIQRCSCSSSRGALHHSQKQQGPTTTATCYVVRLSQARRRVKPAKDLLLKCRSTEYRCCCVASHEHNLLPFGTPQTYPLLSAESKAVSAANHKESLGECHDIVWCHTIITALRDRNLSQV